MLKIVFISRINHNLNFSLILYIMKPPVKYTSVQIFLFFFTFDNDNIIINLKPLVSLHKKTRSKSQTFVKLYMIY